jgi:predicted nucleic acid-binding protein
MLRYLLVTNNIGEFERVPALEVENWVHTAQ